MAVDCMGILHFRLMKAPGQLAGVLRSVQACPFAYPRQENDLICEYL
jgi:hypothetical protein